MVMEEIPIDLILSSEPGFYLDEKGVVLGILLIAIISWGLWHDWKSSR